MAETVAELKRIKPGDFVVLTDDQTIEDMMESSMPGATDGLSLEVSKVLHIQEQNSLCDLYLCELTGSLPPNYPALWLLIKVVDREYDLRIYWQPDEFQTSRTKGDLIDDQIFWLFKNPSETGLDPDNFRPCDLEYTDWIDQDTNGGTVSFDVKGGALHGECRENPTPSGIKQPQPATVVEYITEQKGAEDTEILLLEIGGLNEYGEQLEEGGVLHFYLGSPVQTKDLDLIQR